MGERVEGGGEEVELAVIALEKKAGAGLGFNVVGGRDQEHIPGDPGIFVSRVRRDGAAYNDGRLKEGDRIVSVNGEWLGDVDHDAAVGVLRACSGTVRLQVEPEAERTALNKVDSAFSPSSSKDSMRTVIDREATKGDSADTPRSKAEPPLSNSSVEGEVVSVVEGGGGHWVEAGFFFVGLSALGLAAYFAYRRFKK